jgi:siderophore synthetase component
MQEPGPGLSVIFFNRSHIYLQEMIDFFKKYKITSEKKFKKALFDIINLYIEKEFKNNDKKIKEFLYFQDIKVLFKALLKCLKDEFTYEDYLINYLNK